MNATDPSGFFLKKWWNEIRPFVAVIVAVVATVVCENTACGSAAWAWIAAGSGAAGAAANGGNILQGAVTGLVSAAAFYAVGSAFQGVNSGSTLGTSLSAGDYAAKVLAHSMVGGVMSVLQGGKFGHGFAAAGVTQAFSGGIDSIGSDSTAAWAQTGNRIARIVAAAVVGGTASTITGGKFANGAITGAFSRAFNDEAHANKQKKLSYEITDIERQLVANGKIKEFWESRLAGGDPVARAGLASLNPLGSITDYFFGGTSINNRLQAFANVYNNGNLDMDQVRVDLANAHIRFTDLDTSGLPGLLNPAQIAEYHHQVFDNHGLPPTAFGGTPFTGAVGEAWVTRPVWCGGCDWK